ncbi:MAG TPA: hypothetical protein QGF58_27645 [Myxococcota bacterium]|nr:hypothetical protein [Myxococcota bacterium]
MIWLLSCLAMKRTWEFSADPAPADPIVVRVAETRVQQKDASIELSIVNQTDEPFEVELRQSRLSLPDGEAWPAFVGDGKGTDFARLILGFQPKDEVLALPPGGDARAMVRVHQYGRDLRRHSALTLHLELRVDGQALTVPVVLEAPSEAPMGEHI